MALQVARDGIGRVLGERWNFSGNDQGHQHHLLVPLYHKGAQHVRRDGEELRDKEKPMRMRMVFT